jgi:putative transcriptional regulator
MLVARPLRLAAAALSASAALLGAALPAAGPLVPRAAAREGSSLAGQLLVATESLRDPRFARSVIYVVRHDAQGAMGLIVNRPVQDLPLADLLRAFGRDATGITGSVRAHFGGPVELRLGFVLHTAEYATPFTEPVAAGVAMTPQDGVPELLDAVAHGAGPRKALFALGYSGWAPGQLERELEQGSWITVPADEALLFDEDHARKWERATARRLTI